MKWLYRLAFGKKADWFDAVQFLAPLAVIVLAVLIALVWK